ncbi:ABC transporter substrate-binding protein [Anaerobacillus alkalilacustris]|uniref:ABC transporter substrate-binding protein n=1 Tax=Anaerobacillus alkalilacustris TaxID=393763 RepID=A0A1S2LY67_9BACI|nr:extracellular solute-binding protein [Anaerobacillus alkalilacustris]OIJ17449.1 ABC transporter substrate-binding protein [Anaerobacillus alkalilacustris]
MFKKKAITLFSVFTLFLLVLAACSGSNESNADNGSSTDNGSSAGSDEQVTVNFMHLWPSGSAEQHNLIVGDIISDFESQNPNVKVETEVLSVEQYRERLQILASSNNLPDVGMTWAAGALEPFARGNKFAVIDDMLDGDFSELFIPGTVDAFSYNEQAYALPLELNIAPIYYNTEIFAEHGLDVPETFEEFKHIVETLVDNGVTPITVGNRDAWTGSMWYMYLADRIGGPDTLTNAINRTGTFEDPALIQAAEELQNLVEMNAFVRGFNGLSNDEAKGPFMNNQAAMYLMGSWELPNFTTNESVPQEFRDAIDFFKFPMVDGGQGDINSFVGGPGVGLFVAENSDVKDEAKAFVRFFVEEWGKRSVEDAGVIPATMVDTSTLDLPEMYIDVLDELNNASNITLYADVQMSSSVAQVHLNMIQALFGEQVTPEEFAERHEEALSSED